MPAPRYSVSLEELLALNDELRSLARAGIPLEKGLCALSGDLPGRLGSLALTISERLERGEDLVAVFRDERLSLPPVFSAVVAAGVRSGRLPAALESLTRSVQRTTDLRRMLIASTIYPLIVLMIATVLFTVTWAQLFPRMREILPDLVDREMPAWFQWLTWTVDHGSVWLIAVWILLAVLVVVQLVRSRQARRFGSESFGWPTVGMVNAIGRSATFAELLALLLEHQVPLGEAISLAGGASSDCRIQAAAEELRERIRSGGTGGALPAGLPAVLSWLILTKAPTHQLVKILRQTASGMRARAQRLCLYMGVYLPIVFSGTLGAFIAIYYALLIFAPFYYLLLQLGQP